MGIGTRAILYGFGALALSILVILSATDFGLFPTSSPAFNPASPNSVSILLTDPPSVPEGVTAVYISYANLALHISNFTSSTGYVALNAHGTLDTLALVNQSQTISTENVPSGRYDAVLFRISGVSVTFAGKNYTVTVNNDNLLAPILGRLVVNKSGSSAVLVDIQPSVVNVGRQSNPQFVMTTGAKALQVPPSEVRSEVKQVGYKESLENNGWYDEFAAKHSGRLLIESVALTPNSFSLTLANPTQDALPIKAIVLTVDAKNFRMTTTPASLASSAVFTVGSDGSLTLFQVDLSKGDMVHRLMDLFSGSNFQLGANSSATFTFSGPITASFSSGMVVTSGSGYYVTVITNQALTLGTVQSG